jgi:thiamine monophosphate synthase
MKKLKQLNYSGVAVVSGIMSAEDPKVAVKKYLNELKTN